MKTWLQRRSMTEPSAGSVTHPQVDSWDLLSELPGSFQGSERGAPAWTPLLFTHVRASSCQL